MAELADNGLNRKIVDGAEVMRECDAIEEDIVALRVAYEQYFLGNERHPPDQQHKALKRRLQKLKGAFVRQTSVKFRMNTITSKLLTYERLWSRTIQEIENGTYRRDVYKAKMRAQKNSELAAKAQPGAKQESETLEQPSATPAPGAAAPGTPVPGAVSPVPAAGAPLAAAPRPTGPRPAVSAATALSDASLKAVYNAYINAKRKNGEDVSRLNYDSVAGSLRKQVPELMKKAGASSVEFKIVIKDGKAILRAVPK